MSISDIKDDYLQRRKKEKIAQRLNKVNYSFTGGMGVLGPAAGLMANSQTQLHKQLQTSLDYLNQQQQQLQMQVNQLPAGNLSLRNEGVRLAWDNEQALLNLGGAGTRDWSTAQQQEILTQGKVSGGDIHGHHINNVADHPKLQARADNIDFLTPSEHQRAHGGNWQNSTSGELYNRSWLMKKRVIGQEIARIGSLVLIGGAIGFTLSLFEQHLNWKQRFAYAGEGAKLGFMAYAGGRLGGIAITAAIGSNISEFGQIMGMGIGSSIVMSSYVFYQTKKHGGSNKQAFKATGVNLGISLTGVFITSLAHSIWGGPAGIITGLLFGGGVLAINFFKKHQMEKLIKKLQRYEIELLKPSYC
jgi:hypothetical protein